MTDGPWENLHENGARRVNSEGKFDFFWVRMPDASPGLLLRLSDEAQEIRPLPKLKHVGVFYRIVDGRNCYCITLNERAQLDLFETLCRDVVSAAEMAEDIQGALARAIRRTMRWHQLMRGGKQGMSLEAQRGLLAELAFLRSLAEHVGPLTAIEAWKGPDESAKDFELPNIFFEIKARRSAAHPKVRISSEAQLMDIAGARLLLRVQNVDTSLEAEGDNLRQHVERTGLLFEDDFLALDIWEQRIASTGYAPENIEEERRWHLGDIRTFEVSDGFPRIVPPLPLGIDEVGYSIRLDACSEFECHSDLENLLSKDVADV
jgi:hypothetical protein